MKTIPRSPSSHGRRGPDGTLRLLDSPDASWYLVFIPALLLLFVGGLMALSSSSVYSDSISGSPWSIATRQLVFMVIGVVPTAWLSRQGEARLKQVGWGVFVLSLVLMLAIFVPGLGSDAGKGHLAWLRVGPITLQPSEIAKLGLVMWSAAVLSTKQRVLDRPKELAFPLLVGFGLVLVLVLGQKDLGTALVIGGFFLCILWVVGVPGRMLLALVALGVVLVALLVLTSPNRMIRVMAYLNGSSGDPNASQQPLDSVYALATGGWWGVGLGASRQKWGGLYDGAQNDFVFAVLGEELGLFGTLAVLGLIGVLAFAGVRIAMRSDSLFRRVAASGITAWLVIQSLVNIGVDMEILPVIGVPLPFLSIGGTALVSNMMGIGVLLACARNEPQARAARAARRAAAAAAGSETRMRPRMRIGVSRRRPRDGQRR